VGGAAGAALLAHLLPSVLVLGQWSRARSAFGESVVWRGSANRREAALTFDDGPAPGTTEAVLDTLDELDLRATFFCLGSQVERFPALAREIARRGHEVATHGHLHQSHLRHGPGWVGADLHRSIAAIVEAGLPAPQWFRPPYGHVSSGTVAHARRAGLPVALWSSMGREWAEPSAIAVAGRIGRSLAPGSIVLLHDSDVSNPPGTHARVVAALPQIAADLARRGLAAAVLSELFAPR
jgi:peptidoglycan/xylan/chitin deacetylase (PgdA/CDA1 family)